MSKDSGSAQPMGSHQPWLQISKKAGAKASFQVHVRIGHSKLAACKDIEQHVIVVDGEEDRLEQ